MKLAILFLTSISLAAVSTGFAGTFTANGGQGSSIVDAAGTGDYLSLAAAAADFNSFSGGMTGNYNLLIRSSVTEAANFSFGNATNGKIFTIKPDVSIGSGGLVTVSFTQVAANTGGYIEGHMKFGQTSVNGPLDDLVSMPNIVIDGSATGDGSQNLKFADAVTATNTFDYIVRAIGDCDNFTVKNVKFEHTGSGTSGNICLAVMARRTLTGVDNFSTNVLVNHCDFNTTGTGTDCRGFLGESSNTSTTSGVTMSGQVTNNTFQAKSSAARFTAWGDLTFSTNTISIGPTNFRPQAVLHSSAAGSTNYTWNVYGNKFVKLETNAAGVNSAIGIDAVDPGTYNIYNNFFGGYNYLGSAITGDSLWRTICVDGVAAAGNYNIYHNSFNLAGSAMSQTTKAGRYATVCQFKSNFAGNITVRNNVIRNAQANGCVFFRCTGGTGTFNSDNNDIFLANGCGMASFQQGTDAAATVNITTLSAWQALAGSGRDNASTSEDPFAPASGGAWTSQSDLHFSGATDSAFKGAALSSIAFLGNQPSAPALTIDIDGEARDAINPTKGADQAAAGVATAAGSEWMLLD